jgi:hypothetical protein
VVVAQQVESCLLEIVDEGDVAHGVAVPVGAAHLALVDVTHGSILPAVRHVGADG